MCYEVMDFEPSPADEVRMVVRHIGGLRTMLVTAKADEEVPVA